MVRPIDQRHNAAIYSTLGRMLSAAETKKGVFTFASKNIKYQKRYHQETKVMWHYLLQGTLHHQAR